MAQMTRSLLDPLTAAVRSIVGDAVREVLREESRALVARAEDALAEARIARGHAERLAQQLGEAESVIARLRGALDAARLEVAQRDVAAVPKPTWQPVPSESSAHVAAFSNADAKDAAEVKRAATLQMSAPVDPSWRAAAEQAKTARQVAAEKREAAKREAKRAAELQELNEDPDIAAAMAESQDREPTAATVTPLPRKDDRARVLRAARVEVCPVCHAGKGHECKGGATHSERFGLARKRLKLADESLARPCPACPAAPGEWCVVDGKKGLHRDRQQRQPGEEG